MTHGRGNNPEAVEASESLDRSLSLFSLGCLNRFREKAVTKYARYKSNTVASLALQFLERTHGYSITLHDGAFLSVTEVDPSIVSGQHLRVSFRPSEHHNGLPFTADLLTETGDEFEGMVTIGRPDNQIQFRDTATEVAGLSFKQVRDSYGSVLRVLQEGFNHLTM